MIPKTIHYCWFGREPKTKLMKKCIKSWKKFFPDYTIKEWNEDNYDVFKIPYIKEAYESKKYAFVSDYARFDILYHEGGIYFDTDVEVIKSFADILSKGAFMGCESDGPDELNLDSKFSFNTEVNPGLGIAAAPGLGIYKEMLDFYKTLHFVMPDGTLNTKTIVLYTTNILFKHGLKNVRKIQEVEGIWIYPKEFFAPKDMVTNKIEITDNTHSVHHYSASWYTPKEKLIKFLGPKVTKRVVSIMHQLTKK